MHEKHERDSNDVDQRTFSCGNLVLIKKNGNSKQENEDLQEISDKWHYPSYIIKFKMERILRGIYNA